MLLAADDLAEWVADRASLLNAAWASYFTKLAQPLSPGPSYRAAAVLQHTMLEALQCDGFDEGFAVRAQNREPALKGRLELVEQYYTVTLKLARAAARRAREARTSSAFPYRSTTVVGDGRTDPRHLALEGIVLHRDHPFWRRYHPPLGMQCRCGTIMLTRGQFERRGLKITSEMDLAERVATLPDDWPEEFEPLLDFRA